MSEWKTPQESPLYKDIPNADVDEFGVITEHPYWRAAKRTVVAGSMLCRTCGVERFWLNENGRRICQTCHNEVN
jgi:hypothetical protein